jgi:hypothetical protein
LITSSVKNQIGDSQLTIEFLDRYKLLEIERLYMVLCRTVLYVHRRVLGIVLKVYTSSASRMSPRVALVDLCRDSPCKQPKGQPLFFPVYNWNPEMLPAVGAEELREMLEGTML